jgi:hypothetical protein
MINKFIKYNKKQILFGFKLCAVLFFIFSLILVWIASLSEKSPPDLKTSIIVVIVSVTIAPLFIMTLGYLRWIWDDYVINRNLKSYPFDSLSDLGFSIEMKNINNKWHFTQDIFTGKIDDFNVECIVDNNDPKYIRFKFEIKDWILTRKQYRQLWDDFKKEKGVFDFNGISKKYHRKKHKLRDIDDLKNDLNDFAKFIRKKQQETKIARP